MILSDGLFLENSPFSGTLPTEIGKLTQLTTFHNSNTIITGEIPNEIGNLENLEILIIPGSRYSGPLPPNFYNLDRLTDFFANDIQNNDTAPVTTGLSGTISADISKMTNLQIFLIHGNSFTGELPDEFGDLPNLDFVFLNFNMFNGTAPFCDQVSPLLKRVGEYQLEMDCLDSDSAPALVECSCCDVCCDDSRELCLNNQP
mmetsp:Transcript_18809/g.27206  ORF Transcript_18809/g.27206 Transcript_18809/m.27206 type:complete len:202 (+) Transcript_18809:1423-2028(+)